MYLRAFAGIPGRVVSDPAHAGSCGARTVEILSLLQEPLEPASVKLESLEFLENTTLVDLGIVSELCALYEREYDCVFEAGENGPDPLEGERVS